MKYKITLTKTADGLQDYVQIISEDQFSVNIVLLGEFKLKDSRTVLLPAKRKNERA